MRKERLLLFLQAKKLTDFEKSNTKMTIVTTVGNSRSFSKFNVQLIAVAAQLNCNLQIAI